MVKIPERLEELLPVSAVEKFLDAMQQPDLSGKVRETLDRIGGLAGGNPIQQMQQAWQQARSWIESISGGAVSNQPQVINATGQLIGNGFANVPMPSAVTQSFASSASRFLDQAAVKARAERTIANAFAGVSAAWCDSSFAAMQCLLAGRTVLLPRSSAVRIVGVGEVREGLLMGLEVREVGPANGCTDQDWKACIEDLDAATRERACILYVSPTGLLKDAAAEQESIAKQAASEFDLPLIAFRADAILNERLQASFGFSELVDEKATVTIAPLNMFLGAPRGTIVIGEERWIDRCQRRATSNGTLLNGPNLLAANLALQLQWLENADDGDEQEELTGGPGVLGAMTIGSENLKNRANRLAQQVDNQGPVASATAVERDCSLGPAPWNTFRYVNWAVEIEAKESVEALHQQLLAGATLDEDEVVIKPIAAAVEDGKLMLDLRFVDPEDDHQLVLSLQQQH